MNTKLTLLAALLFAGASQAALAQDHGHGDRGDRGDRPQSAEHAGGGGGHWQGRGGGAPPPAPSAPPPAAVIAPQGGHARFGAPPPPPAVGAAPAPAVVPAPQGGDRHGGGGDHRGGGDGDRRDGDRRGGGDRNSFGPGGAAGGDRHWDRRDAPREVVPATPGEHGWDRDHDGHAGDARHLDRDGRGDGRWDRDRRDGDRRDWGRRDGDRRDGDHRGPPSNWRHWERGQFPPVFSSPHRYRVSPYRAPYGFFVRSWAFGDFLPRGWFGPSYWIDDFYDYDLPWPPPGYHWVRVGPDVLLVDDYSGRIVQVIRDMFW